MTSPWQVSVEGECNKPRTFDLDELLRLAPFEERIYRMLCNEGFLHVVPYLGYSLSRLLAKVEPTGNAKFLEMTSVMRPTQLPGQREVTYIPWPYVEGLRIDEAMHPLTLVALGAYGQILPKGLGAPIAIRAPWKFGTKSPKAVVKLRLTEKQPATIWNSRFPKYHSFWGNINPAGATNFLGQGQQERKYGDLVKGTGLAMDTNAYRDYRPLHSWHDGLSDLLLFASAIHVVGVLLTSYIHRENLPLSMFTGKKRIDRMKPD